MTSVELRTYLKAWITQVLITEGGETGLPIIASHQNAPSFDKPYITISYGSDSERVGRAAKGDVYFNVDDEDDPLNGTRLLISDWQLKLEIRETNGEGDRLKKLLDSLDREDIYPKYFTGNGIAHYQSTVVQMLPRLNQDDWIQESIVEMQIGSAEGTRENSGYIDTVEYEGTIGGK